MAESPSDDDGSKVGRFPFREVQRAFAPVSVSHQVNRLTSIFRNLLWIEGAFLCLLVPQVAHYLIQHSGDYHSSDPKFLVLLTMVYGGLTYLLALGSIALAAAYSIGEQQHWARKAALVVSAMNLPLVPIGTVLGGVGLWLVQAGRLERDLMQPLGAAASPKDHAKRQTAWMARVVIAAQYLASLLLAPLTAAFLARNGLPTLNYWQFALSFQIAVLVSIFCHEMGHVIAGMLSGMRFQTMSAGPIVVSSLSDGWRVQWVNSLGLWAGLTVMAPRSPERLRSNAVFLTAGGPAGSLVCGAGALAVLLAAPRIHLGAWAEFFGILGTVGLVSCVGSLIPVRTPGGYSDGARLLHLVRRSIQGDRFLAELACGLSDTTTLRPRDWHPTWIKTVTEDPDWAGFSRGCYHAYVHHLDRGEIDDASIWLARCMDSHQALKNDPYRWILAIENAFFEARHLKNIEGSKEWLTVPKAGIPAERFTLLRVQAAIHAAEGERELTRQTIDAAVRIHAESTATGRQQFERAVLLDVQNWAEELHGPAGLSRLAQSLRDQDDALEKLRSADALPSKINAVRNLMKK
jgi:hypothetical protein